MARILIIDDDELVRAALRLMLGREGHDVTEAVDGRKGIAQQRQCPFDLVVVDLIMPDKEGIETILELRKLAPNLAIVAISGGARIEPEELLKLARCCGANVTFSKPVDRREFVDEVSRLLLTVQPSLSTGLG